MAPPKKRGVARKRPLTEVLSAMLAHALEQKEDFILTCETDPDSGTERVHAMTGKFVSECMLRKLIGKAESQRDEGSSLVTRRYPKMRAKP